MQDAEQFLGFLHSLSDMGAAMRRVMAEALTNKDIYKSLTTGKLRLFFFFSFFFFFFLRQTFS